MAGFWPNLAGVDEFDVLVHNSRNQQHRKQEELTGTHPRMFWRPREFEDDPRHALADANLLFHFGSD